LAGRLLRAGVAARQNGDARERVRLGVVLGQVNLALGRRREARAVLERAQTAAETMGLAPVVADARVALVDCGDGDPRLRAQAALATAQAGGSAESVQAAALALGEAEWRAGAPTLAWAHLRAAVQALRETMRELAAPAVRAAYRERRRAFMDRVDALAERLGTESDVQRWAGPTGMREVADWLAEVRAVSARGA